MKSVSNNKITRILTSLIIVILVLVPLCGFMTVWGASITGGYTLWRLWDEGLLTLLLFGAIYLLIINRSLGAELARKRFFWLILAYVLIQVIWGIVAFVRHDVDAKALGYGWIVNLRFLLFFLAVWVVACKGFGLKEKWPKFLFIPAAVVVIFGLLQILVLPHDFLSHFGYGSNTIYPYETINHNSHYVRIESTLRGANPLGAYLVIIISALAALLLAAKRKLKLTALLLAVLVVLFFSFSRSAWIGALISAVALLGLSLHSKRAKKVAGLSIAVLAIAAAGLFLAFRHDARFENYVLHTQAHSKIKTTSNEGHVSALSSGLKDLEHEPLGRGPGTAGPASIYNDHPARIAEDYYVQVGQETGWLGLVVFVAILVEAARLLWQRKGDRLSLILFVALLGITFVNLLSHAWTDDTLAYIWWGLAAVAVAPKIMPTGNKK
jgi:hypothetical protein